MKGAYFGSTMPVQFSIYRDCYGCKNNDDNDLTMMKKYIFSYFWMSFEFRYSFRRGSRGDGTATLRTKSRFFFI